MNQQMSCSSDTSVCKQSNQDNSKIWHEILVQCHAQILLETRNIHNKHLLNPRLIFALSDSVLLKNLQLLCSRPAGSPNQPYGNWQLARQPNNIYGIWKLYGALPTSLAKISCCNFLKIITKIMYVVHLKLSVATTIQFEIYLRCWDSKNMCHCQHMMNSARLTACLLCFLTSMMNFKLDCCNYT